MLKKILIIGIGCISNIIDFKRAMNADTFREIALASHALSKCDDTALNIKEILCRNI